MDRFEAIKLAFTEAKKTGTSLKTKHIEWLILEVESLTAEGLKMGKQLADSNAVEGERDKGFKLLDELHEKGLDVSVEKCFQRPPDLWIRGWREGVRDTVAAIRKEGV